MRRLFAGVLGITTVVVVLVSAFLLRVEQTFFSPTFINHELEQTDVVAFLYDKALPAVAEENAGELPGLPLGMELTLEMALAALREAVPPAWLEAQVKGAVENVVPYLTGERDDFVVNVPLAARVEAAVPVMKRRLERNNAYERMRDDIVHSVVEEQVPQTMRLPLGETVTSREIAGALRRAIPPERVQEEAEQALDDVSRYMTGRQEGFELRVSLEPFMAPVAEDVLGFDVPPEVERAFQERMPLVYTFTEEDLRRRLDPEQWARLQEVRRTVADGWTLTQADLREGVAGEGGEQTLERFDRVRGIVALVRSLDVLVYVAWALLLLLVGVLGGRSWPGRLAWAASFLALSALVTFLVAGPGYTQIVEPRMVEALAPSAEAPSLEQLAMGKLQEVSTTVARDFLAGPYRLSMWMLAIGLAGVVVSLGSGRRRRTGGGDEARHAGRASTTSDEDGGDGDGE